MKRIVIPAILVALLSLTSCMRGDLYDNDNDKTSLLQLPGFGGTPRISSITSSTPNGSYTAGQTIDLIVTFSEPVTLAGGTLDLTLNNGAVLNIPAFGPSITVTVTYTIVAGDNSISLNVSSVVLSVGATLTDGTGDSASMSLPFFNNLRNNTDFVIDTTQPTITSITSSKANGSYGVGQTVPVTINFSENVTLSAGGSLDLTLDSGGTLSIPAFTSSNQAMGTYTIASGNNSADLNVSSIIIGAGTLTDAAGNSADLTLPATENLSDNKNIAIDTIAPMISSIDSATTDGMYGIGDPILVTINFSEPVTLAGGSMLVNLDSFAGATVTINSFSNSTTATGTYTIASGHASPDLNVSNITHGGTLRDASGNDCSITIPAGMNLADMRNFVVDGIRPSISSVTTTTPDGIYGQAATIDVILTFTEPVSLTGGPIALNLNTGGTAGILDFALSASATGNYSVASPQATPELDVSSITIGAAQLTDAAGNTALTVLPVGSNLADTSTIVIDAVAPAIQSITSATANGTYGVGAAINVTVNFTENVTLSGGTLEIVLDTGGTVSIPVFGPSTSANGTYTVGPMQTTGDLTVSPGGISLAGGTLVDAAGNVTDLSIPAGQNLGNNKAIAVDSDGGTVTAITSTAADGSYGDGQTVDVVLTFSEPVTLAGGNIQVSLDTGDSIAISPFTNATTGVGTYTIASPDTSPDLNVIGLGLDGGATLTDQYGNTTALGMPAGNNLADNRNIAIDSTAPTIASVTTTAGSGTYGPAAGPAIDITVTFSESVTMTGVGANMEVTLNSGHVLNYSSITATTSETVTYTVLAGEDTGGLDLQVAGISVAGGTIADAAGNLMVDFAVPINLPAGIFIDGIAPVLTSITSSAANGTYGQGASIEVILTFSEGVILSGPITLHLDSGGTVTIPGFSGLSVVSDFYNVTVPQTSPDLNVTSIDLGSETIRDVAQNDTVMTLPAGNNLADNSNIVINAVAPTIQSIISATANGTYGSGSPIDITINFSDNVALTGGNMELTLDSGGVVTIGPFALSSSASGTYMVAAGESSSDLTVNTINLIGATLQDGGGNNADLTLPAGQNLADTRDIVVDAYGGTVTSITSGTPDGLFGPGQTLDVVVTFSEPVTLAGNDLILNLDTGYVLHISPFTNSTIGTGFYTIAANDASPDLNATSIGLLGGATIEDQYGNPTTLLLPFGNNLADLKALVVDGVAPTISTIYGTNNAYREGQTVNFTIEFSEPVILSGGTIWLQLNTGGSAFVAPFGSSNTCTASYLIGGGENTTDLTVNNGGISLTGGTLMDAAGNTVDLTTPASNLAATTDIVVDTTVPIITSIYGTNGTFGNGQTVNFTVQFSEPVTLAGGTIQLGMDSGGTAVVSSCSNSSTATATYTVGPGQNSPDLTVSIGSITLPTGTLTDAAGNGADLTVPGSNLAVTSDIVIDTSAPAITSISGTNGTYGETQVLTFTVQFTEAVTLSGGTIELALNSGGTAVINTCVSSFMAFASYTVGTGENAADLTVVPGGISLTSGTLTDGAGNSVDLTEPGSPNNLGDINNIAIDTTAPTIASITSATADGSYNNMSTVDITVNMSEPVTLAGACNVQLDTGAIVSVSSAVYPATVLNGTYAIGAGENSPDLDATGVSIAGTLTDAAGNGAVTTLPGSNLAATKAIVIDTIAPAVDYITSATAAGAYNEPDAIDVTVAFTEPVTCGGSITVTFDTGGTAVIGAFGPASVANGTYTVGAGHNSTRLQETLIGAVGAVTDQAGNAAVIALPANTIYSSMIIVIDTIAPTITSIYGTNGSFNQGQTLNFTVEFSEGVFLTGGNMLLAMDTGGTATVTSCPGLNAPAASYTVGAGENTNDLTVNPGGISLSAGSLTDEAGNIANLTVPGSNLAVTSDIVIDTSAPSLAYIGSSMMGSYGAGSTIFMDVYFTEPVTLSGTLELTLDTGDVVSVTGSYPTTMLSGSYTVGAGDNSPDLAVSSINLTGTLRDAALNSADTTIETGENLWENANIVIDTTAPAIASITSSTANGWYNNTSSVDITVNMSEPVTLTGAFDLQLDTGDWVSVNAAVYPATVLNGTYSIGAGDTSPDLDVTSVSLGGTLLDAASNGANTSLPASNLAVNRDIVIDTTPPEMTSFTSATPDGSYRQGDVIDVTATFNEPVVLSGGTLDVNFNTGETGVISAFGPAAVASGTYTVGAGANIGHLSENTWGFSGWLQDRAGNSINISMPPVTINSTKSIAIDTTDPYIVSVTSSTADGSYKEGDIIDVTVTFNEPVTLTGGLLDITFDTSNVVHIPAFGPSLTATGTYTVGAGETSAHLNETAINSSGSFVDAAGNTVLGTWPSTTISSSKSFVIDTTAPSITHIASATANGSYGLASGVNVTVYLTEPVTLTGTMDLTLDTGATVSVSSGAYPATELSGTYTVGAGENSGDLTVTGIIVTGTLQDAAKNDSSTTIPFLQNLHNYADIAIDTTAPTITSVTALESTPGTYYNGGGPGTGYIIVRVNFSDVVTLTGGGSQHMDVTLNSGKTLVFGAFGTGNTICMNYSVEAGNTTGGGDLEASSIAVFNGQIVDQAGNQMTDFTIGSPVMTGFIVDGVGPTCSVSIGSNNGFGGTQYARESDTITIIVDPDEPINQPTVTIAGAGVTASPDAGDTWKAVYVMPGGYTEGNIPYTVTGVTDTAGNTGTVVPDGSYVYYSDALPTVTQVYVNGANTLTNADVTAGTVSVQITFSKQMYTLTNPSPTISGLASSIYTITGSSWSNGDTRWTGTFTLVDDNEDTTGTYNITGFQDIMGNTMTPTAAYTVAVDTQTPIGYIAINYLNKSQYGTVVDVAVQFDTTMNTSIPGTASLSIPSTASSYSLSSAGWTGNTLWTGQFTFNDVDDANIDATTGTFNVTGFEDAVGNVMDPLARNIVVDTKQPTVGSVDSLTPDGTYGVGYGVDITVNFTEPVTMTGDNLTVRFADFPTTANLGQFPLSTSVHATYTVVSNDATASLNVYSPSGIDPGAGSLRDAAGNDADLASFPPVGNNLADNTDIVIDGVQPMISYIWSSGAMSSYSAGQSVNVTLHFTESVNLNIGDLQIPLNSGGTAIATAPQSGTDISATYIVGAGESTPLLDVNGPITLTAGSLRDDAGNDANIITIPSIPNRLSDNDPISIDGSIPTIADVTADTTVDGAYGAGAAIDVTINFSEQVALTGGPITVNFDGGGTMQINDFALSTTATGTYTVAASQNSADLYISGFNLGGATIKDAAGNNADLNILADNNLAFDRAIVIDTFAPTITSVTSATASGSYGNGQVIEISVNFSEPVTKVGAMPLYMDLNSGASAQHINTLTSQDTVSINYTIGVGDNTSPAYLAVTNLYVTSSTIQDAAGNLMADFSIPINIDINLIVIDAVPPTINTASTMDADNDGRIDHYRITFSEPVNDGTFPGYSANSIGSPQAIWSVAGYSNLVLAHGTSAPMADTANDSVIYLRFDEMTFPDTGAKPDLQTTSAGAINDMTGNILDTVAMATVTEIDGVNPRIESIVGAAGSDTVVVSFTEPVDATMGGGCSGTLSSSNFTYQDTSGADVSAIMNLSLDSNACDDQSVVIRTNTAVTTNDIDVDGLMPPASIIRDAADNTAMPNVYTMRGLTKSMQLTFDTTSSGANVSSPVSNFPLLVRLSDPGIINAVRDGAPDLRFRDPDGTPLAYQIERWDKGNIAAEVWVLVPEVLGNSNTDYITMYFDDKTDDTVPGRQEPGKVFGTGNNFAGVWHLSEDSGQAYDSTANKNNSTTNTAVFDSAGYIGNSRQFSSSATYIEIPDTNDTLDGVGTIVLSAWVRHNDPESISTQKIISKKYQGTESYGYELFTNTMNEYIDFKANSLSYFRGTAPDLDSTWHFIVMGLQGSATRIAYFDGTTLTPANTPTAITAGTYPLVIGATSQNHTPYFSGSIDEVRVETGSLRSVSWYKLCYENQRQDQTLIKYWYDDAWNYRIKVTIQSAQVAGTVMQFPVYVNLANLGSNFWSNVTGSGNILVTTGNGITKVPREVVSFTDSGSSGTGELWFMAPNLDPGKTVSFYVYFGGTGSDSNDTAVWSNGYTGVWHLQSSAADSSPYGNSGTPISGSFATGMLGNSFILNGSTSFIDVNTAPSLNPTGQLTLSAWFRSGVNLSGMTVLSKRTAVLPLGYNMTVDTLNDILNTSTGVTLSPGAAALSAGELGASFYHYATAINGTTCAVYLNGTDRTTDSTIDNIGISGTNLNIGRMTDGTGYFNGALDEVRISNVQRSASWLLTEYNNQSSPASFYSVSGTLESK